MHVDRGWRAACVGGRVMVRQLLRSTRRISRPAPRTLLVLIGSAAAVLVVASPSLDRPPLSRPRTNPIEPTIRPPGRASEAAPHPLVRVGTVEITEGDLRRYNEVARLSGRSTVRGRDLDEVVTRTLLCLEADSRGIELSPAERAQALRRRRALAALAMGPAATAAHAIADQDLAREALLDALAEKLRRTLADHHVDIDERDVDAAPRASGPRRARVDRRVRREIARALRTERGRTLLPGLIAELRRKWPVEVLHEP